MKKRLSILLMVCILLTSFLLPASALAKAKQMNDGVPVWDEDTVRQYLLDYIGGKEMSRLYGYYDLQIRRYMPLAAFESFLNEMEWMTGAFEELGDSYTSFTDDTQKLKTHVLHLCMETQDLDFYFTHKDKEDDWEVMAIQFVPAERAERPSGSDHLVGGANVTYAPSYIETEVSVGTEAAPLSGILTMPQEASEGKTVPACVLVHDRGPMDKDGTWGATTILADLAHTLGEMGVATLRYDKRTYTYGEFTGMTVWEEAVEDAILAGKQLQENLHVDQSRIVVVGVGFGAMLAPRIASQSEGVFTGMLLIGGTPKTFARLLYDESDLSAYTSAEKKEMLTIIDNLGKMDETEASSLSLFDRNGHYFWEMEQYDPVKLITKMKLPTFIVQGSKDSMLSEDEGWRLYSEKIGDGITYVSFKSFRGLNHLLMNDLSTDERGVSQYTASTSLDKTAGRSLSQWILSLNQTNSEE